MSKRHHNNNRQHIAKCPWQVTFLLAMIAPGLLQIIFTHLHLPGWENNSITNALDRGIHHSPLIKFISWGIAVWFLLIAFISYRERSRRAKLLETRTNLASLQEMTWQQFEQLVGEAYRRQGYAVIETGQGGADGGIDLILTKPGVKIIVQCKRWATASVGAPVVREQYGLMMAEQASRCKIVCCGKFTKEAIEFAAGKPIDLVDGPALLALVKEVQGDEKPTVGIPACPDCGHPMIKRSSIKSQSQFWGCVNYPKCKGLRPLL